MHNVSTVKELVSAAALEYKEKDFCRYIVNGAVNVKSYKEFYEDCLAVSRYIRTTHTDRIHIGFIGKTSYEYIACLTGMIFSGNTVVPFAPDITTEEACLLFEDADIEILFCEEEFREKAEIIFESCDALKKIVSLGDKEWFADIFRAFSSDSDFAQLKEGDVNPDDCALIIYTSGTTGDRKGVMLSNRNLAANSSYEAYSMDNDDVSFSILPMHHVFCYACDVLKTLYDGGTLCLNGSLTDMFRNFLIFEPTIMRIVPAICKSVLTRIKITERKKPQLSKREAAELVVGRNFRRMIAGSAFLSGAIIDEFEQYGITARQGYGMSECSPRITTSDFSDKNKYSNGRLIGVDDVRVVDGEIQVKGPSVMLGYYKKPEQTAEAFTEDGYLHTGDLGYIDGDHVYLVGRKKNLIILSNGENISPEEIENCFADDIVIKGIIVFAENDRIVAEIFPELSLFEGFEASEIEMKISETVDRVNLMLHSDRQISSFRLRETPFPRTSTGKIKRTTFFIRSDSSAGD
ncbi:MAG: AMP-binding protein [Clostridia bacterium]|nr:AMP-binding protein [Clostridia bacterium]